jgi:hypothetical protein
LFDQINNKAFTFVAEDTLLYRVATMELVSMQDIVDNQQQIHPVAGCFLCWSWSTLVYNNGLGDSDEIVTENGDPSLGGSYVLHDPLCAFLRTAN